MNEYPPKPITNKDANDKTEVLDTIVTPQKVLKDSPSMDARVEKVKSMFDKYEELDVPVTNEMASGLIEKEFGLTAEEFFGQGIKDEEIESIDSDIASQLKSFISQKEENKGSTLKFLREKMFSSRFSKAVVLSIILTFKFGGASFAAEKKGTPQIDDNKGKFKTEVSQKVNHEGGDGDKDTYKVTTEDLKNMVDKNTEKEIYKVNMTNSFEPDQAKISPENADKIATDVHKVLDKITPDNFKDFMAAKKVISASSSEEPTKFGDNDKNAEPKVENNTKLTDSRWAEGNDKVSMAIKSHDFSKSGLSSAQIQQIKDIKFEKDVPEKGYKTILEANKINPATGKPFTANEIKELKEHNYPEYKKLSDENRYVKVDFKVESFKNLVNLSPYAEWSAYCDHSPSTGPLAAYLAEQFKLSSGGQNADKTGELFFFSNKVDVNIKTTASKAVEQIKSMRSDGDTYEKVFTSLCSGLEKTAKSDIEKYKGGKELPKRVAYVITDEALQDAQKLTEAVKLADKTNTDVKIILKGKVFDIHDIKSKLDNAIAKTASEILSKGAADLEQQKVIQHEKLVEQARDIAKNMSNKTFKQLFGEKEMGDEESVVKKLITEDYKIPPFEKAEKSRIEDKKLRDLLSIKDITHHIESSLDAKLAVLEKGEQGIGDYLKDKVVIIKTLTNENGDKVTLGLNEDKTSGAKNIFVDL